MHATSFTLQAMAEDDPEAALLIRTGGRTIHLSPDDIAQIREAVDKRIAIFLSAPLLIYY